ncbi:PucR family transcriptional regulator [Salininema proteolyticum]|uniref:PucR family transcriptional regulator n=1 Tax=Salininema proteolyticum TaxID=1607685 RepID=A0ABV8TVU5_9ACTN
MRLDSLTAAPELGMTVVEGRARLGRSIRWVVPTDLGHPGRYLSGGELVLTRLLWHEKPGDSERFVAELAEAGATALGACGPEGGAIPEDLREACRKWGLPLFAVEPTVAFSDITEFVARRLVADRSGDLAELLDRYRRVIMGGRSLESVLDLVAKEAGIECQVISPTGRTVHGSETENFLPLGGAESVEVAAKLLKGGTLPRRVRSSSGRILSAFGAGDSRHTGWFVLVEEDHRAWTPERRSLMDQLTTIVGWGPRQARQRPQADLDLIADLKAEAPESVLEASCRRAGIDPGGHLTVCVVRCDSPDLAASAVEEVVGSQSVHCAWLTKGDTTVAVAELDDEYEAFYRAVRARAAALSAGMNDTVRVGIASPVSGTAKLTAALAEASFASRLAGERGAGVTVADESELTSHELLLSVVPDELKQAFLRRTLEPVLAYDRRHRSELTKTLTEFLRGNGSWSRCASHLHLHVNTLRYRIERIEKLTGRDMAKIRDRVDLYLAVQML